MAIPRTESQERWSPQRTTQPSVQGRVVVYVALYILQHSLTVSKHFILCSFHFSTQRFNFQKYERVIQLNDMCAAGHEIVYISVDFISTFVVPGYCSGRCIFPYIGYVESYAGSC